MQQVQKPFNIKSLGTSSWEVDWGTCGYKVVRKITMTNCKQEVVWLRHMT